MLASTACIVLIAAGSSRAADYTFANPIASNPSAPDLGLSQSIYDNAAVPTLFPPRDPDIDSVVAYTAANAPSYTYTNLATKFTYPNPSSTIAQFLGVDAIPGTSAASDANGTSNFIVDAKGYLSISQPGVYDFTIYADDAGRAYVNGNGATGSGTRVSNTNYDGSVGQHDTSVQFAAAGVYPLEIWMFQSAYGASFFFGITPPAGATAQYMTTVPEPSALTVLGIPALLRRRRQRVDTTKHFLRAI